MPVVRRRWWPLPPLAVAILPGFLALGIYLWQLSVPEQVAFYDTGVYLGASIHLISGVLPYRDFTFVQPPGVLYILSPIALFSRFAGTHNALTAGRVLTSCVSAANCSLVAWLIRRHGRLAMSFAGVGLAILPVMFLDSSAIRLEPYCVALVLGSALLLLGREGVSQLTPKAAILAGVLMGAAVLVKLWAVFPFAALTLLLLLRARSRILMYVAVAAGTFFLGVAPLALAAPRNFVSEVLVAQLRRPSDGATWIVRLRVMTGLWSTSLSPSDVAAVVVFTAIAALAAFAYRHWRHVSDADIAILLLAVFSATMLMLGSEFYTYYPCFTSPFLVALAVVAIATLFQQLRRRVRGGALSHATRMLVRWTIGASGLLVVVGTVLYATSFYTNYAWFKGTYQPWVGAISRVVPRGACVVYTEVAFGLYANRFTASNPACPDVVDVFGESMAYNYGVTAHSGSFARQWQSYFEKAQYVVLTVPYSSYVPWSRGLDVWFDSHYRRIYDHAYVVIYENDAS